MKVAVIGGGRARSVSIDGRTLDNGQHILLGAYHDTLALMQLENCQVLSIEDHAIKPIEDRPLLKQYGIP